MKNNIICVFCLILALLLSAAVLSGCINNSANEVAAISPGYTIKEGSAVSVTKDDATGIISMKAAADTSLGTFRQEVTANEGCSYKIFDLLDAEITDDAAIIKGGYRFSVYKDGNNEPVETDIIAIYTLKSTPSTPDSNEIPMVGGNDGTHLYYEYGYTIKDGSTLVSMIIDNHSDTISIKVAAGTTLSIFKQEVTAIEGNYYIIHDASGSEITDDHVILSDGDQFIIYKNGDEKPFNFSTINITTTDEYIQRTEGCSIKDGSSVVTLNEGIENSCYLKVAADTPLSGFKQEVTANKGYSYQVFNIEDVNITDESTILADGDQLKLFKNGETQPEETDTISVQPKWTIKGDRLITLIHDKISGKTIMKTSEAIANIDFKQAVIASKGYYYKIFNTSGTEITDDWNFILDGFEFKCYKEGSNEPCDSIKINITF